MAITWNDAYNHDGSLKATYSGCVVGLRTEHCVRVMSDVWANMFYAVVWDGSKLKDVHYGDSEFGTNANVEIDATPEVLDLAHAWKEERHKKNLEAEALRKIEETKEREAEKVRVAKAQVLEVAKGKRVRTVASRGKNAPPLGTEGVVFWSGFSSFGTSRVGLKTDDGTTWWTTAGNCAVVLPDVPFGGEPANGWVAYRDSMKAAEIEEIASLPKVGDKVRLISTGQLYDVFWAKGHRLGLKVDARDRNENPVWANADEVEPPEVNSETHSHDLVVNPERVRDLPPPFNEIRRIRMATGGLAALDSVGNVVTLLTPETALQLTA